MSRENFKNQQLKYLKIKERSVAIENFNQTVIKSLWQTTDDQVPEADGFNKEKVF